MAFKGGPGPLVSAGVHQGSIPRRGRILRRFVLHSLGWSIEVQLEEAHTAVCTAKFPGSNSPSRSTRRVPLDRWFRCQAHLDRLVHQLSTSSYCACQICTQTLPLFIVLQHWCNKSQMDEHLAALAALSGGVVLDLVKVPDTWNLSLEHITDSYFLLLFLHLYFTFASYIFISRLYNDQHP